jgi:hypothetical protein
VTVTVYGVADRVGDIVEHHTLTGRPAGGHTIDTFDPLPRTGIDVDVDHSGEAIGRVVHLDYRPCDRMLRVS